MKHYIIVAVREDLLVDTPELRPTMFRGFNETEAEKIWELAERFSPEVSRWCQEIKFG